MKPNIVTKYAAHVARILLCKICKLNLVEKSATIAETIFPKGLLIIGAPCRWGGPGSYESL